ncbi:MAG: argininosuccinate lyase [Acidimicrobiales bacterium]
MGGPSGREERHAADVMTLWSGRFSSPMAESLWDLSESFSFDHVLYAHDIRGTAAHVQGLNKAGLLSDEECALLLTTLEQVSQEFRDGTFVRHDGDEDVHMAIERRATEIAGPAGAKIHTARSRNDQVATTLRLFTRDAVTSVASEILELVDALNDVGARYPSANLPGYTHLQRAQPVLLAHHLAAHSWSLLRDVDRLLDTRERLNVSPLGAGALAGTSLPIEPAFTAKLLGFREAFANSMDAVSDRDFVAETLFDVALVGIHLSRMGEEMVLWTSSEFHFASLGDDFTTGSSMLPQKKNSDVAELARGKSGRLVGNLTSVLVTLKGLPLSYNRDLQEDKEPLFDSLRQVVLVLRAMTGAYRSLAFDEQRARDAADDVNLVAIDLAERLVERGVPFRQAHERVGQLVGEADRRGVPFSQVVAEDPELSHFADLFAAGASLRGRTSPGAAGPSAWAEQSARLHEALGAARQRLT